MDTTSLKDLHEKFYSQDHSTGGWRAGRLSRNPIRRLASLYYRWIDKHGDYLEVVSIGAYGAVPSALVFALSMSHGPFWAITTTTASVGLYAVGMISVISLRDKLRDRDDRICELNNEVMDLHLDVQHWKALTALGLRDQEDGNDKGECLQRANCKCSGLPADCRTPLGE